jgi:hypothetical protein
MPQKKAPGLGLVGARGRFVEFKPKVSKGAGTRKVRNPPSEKFVNLLDCEDQAETRGLFDYALKKIDQKLDQ